MEADIGYPYRRREHICLSPCIPCIWVPARWHAHLFRCLHKLSSRVNRIWEIVYRAASNQSGRASCVLSGERLAYQSLTCA